MDPQELIAQLIGYGQKYRDLSVGDRFGEFGKTPEQLAIQRLIEQETQDVWGREEDRREPQPIERSWPSGFIRI